MIEDSTDIFGISGGFEHPKPPLGTPLARPTSRCILFDGGNISFDASLLIHINSTNIPQIMIINRIYKNQNLLSLFFLPGRAKDLSAPL